MQSNVSPLFKTLSLAGLLQAATQSQAAIVRFRREVFAGWNPKSYLIQSG